MKIHNINNYINYNGNTKLAKHEETIKSKNYDVIEINKDKTTKDKSNVELQKIRNDITSKINKETSSEKVESIKESIKNNTYQIDVDEIVNRLLDK